MLEVTGAEYVEGYKIRVAFSNGDCGVVDLADSLWGPVFEPLKDPAMFRGFKISEVVHTLVWENGADLAPEYLHRIMAEPSRTAREP